MPFSSNKIQSYLLFILISAVILFRSSVEKNNYCTPDSYYYLEVSANILKGLGPVIPITSKYDSVTNSSKYLFNKTQFGHPELYQKQYFAVWPLAYPAGILSISYITRLSPLWASKVFNIILLGIDFYLLTILLGSFSSLSIYYFGSFTMLEICSHTWSENLFIPFFLLFIIALKSIHQNLYSSYKNNILLIISLIGLCLTRYSSVIYLIITGVFLFINFIKLDFKKVKSLTTAIIVSSIVIAVYLFINYTKTGYITGMPRVNTQLIPFWKLVGKFWMGLFNQLHVIKQCRFGSNSELIFYIILALIQLFLTVYIIKVFKKNNIKLKLNILDNILITNAFIYLVFITYLTFHSTIDPFDYRTLLPFSLPIMIVLLSQIEKSLTESYQNKAILLLKAFFIFSIIMNLPKQYLIDLILH